MKPLSISLKPILYISYHSPKYSGSLNKKTNKIEHRISNKLLCLMIFNRWFYKKFN